MGQATDAYELSRQQIGGDPVEVTRSVIFKIHSQVRLKVGGS
jgi:hypothetical protein